MKFQGHEYSNLACQKLVQPRLFANTHRR